MTGIAGGTGSLDAQFGTKNHDGNLHEQFGAAGIAQPVGKTGHAVTDQQARKQSQDQAGFRAQAQCPWDTLLGQLGGIGRNVGIGAHGVAGHGNEENDREGREEAPHVAVHQFHAKAEQRRHKGIGGKQGTHAGDDLAGGTPALERISHPHAHLQCPAQHVKADKLADGKYEDNAAEKQRNLIFIKSCFRCHIPTPQIRLT